MTDGVDVGNVVGRFWGTGSLLLVEVETEVGAGGIWVEVAVGPTVDGVTVLDGAVVIVSRLRLFTMAGALSLSTGKSPGFKLQLGLLAMREDSTSWRFGLDIDL